MLDIRDLSFKDIQSIFEIADRLHAQDHTHCMALNGKYFALFFPESSLRTRVTFEKGIKQLGGECLLFPPETLDKKESLSDVIKYLENWVDGVIVRHPDYAKIQELARSSSIPIINAMTSTNHPCEVLSDLYAISRTRDNFTELVYTFVGPMGNVCKSWVDVASVANLNFNHVCMREHAWGEDGSNYRHHTELESVLMTSDVIITDSLPTGLRSEVYIEKYQITLERMKTAKSGAMLNPCPPFERGEMVSADAIASDYFVGYTFKQYLLDVQQAVVLYCL